jgi:hypothetical protein
MGGRVIGLLIIFFFLIWALDFRFAIHRGCETAAR